MSNIQPVFSLVQESQVLAGTQSVYGAVGERDVSVQAAFAPFGTMLAPESGVEYIAPKITCCWDDYTCKANPAKGTPLCFGHLQSWLKHGDGMVKGDEAQRLIQYKEQYKEIMNQRLEDKAKEKTEHWEKHGPKDEVTNDES